MPLFLCSLLIGEYNNRNIFETGDAIEDDGGNGNPI